MTTSGRPLEMDDSVTDILNVIDASTLSGSDAAHSPEQLRDKEHGKNQSGRRWGGLSALKAQASMQDKLLEK